MPLSEELERLRAELAVAKILLAKKGQGPRRGGRGGTRMGCISQASLSHDEMPIIPRG